MITTGIIKNLKPCASRFENYLNYYENRVFTYVQFISLDEISFEDKVWILTRLMTLENMILFSQDAARYAVQDADQDAAKSADQYAAAQCAQEAAQNAAQYAARCAQYAQDAARCAQYAQDAAQYAQCAAQHAQHATRYALEVISPYVVLNLTLKYL